MSELYDTCVFIDYWRGDTAAETLVKDAMRQPRTVAFSPISSTELWQWDQLGRREEIEYIALMSHFMQEVPLTTSMAMRAGQWLRSMSRAQRRKLLGDALLASTADDGGLRIRSRNVKDLQRFYPDVVSY